MRSPSRPLPREPSPASGLTDSIVHAIACCRVCRGDALEPVIDLGLHHLSGIFVDDEIPEGLDEQFPLAVVRCADPDGCGLVQLAHSIDPSVMYAHYGYRSGTNEMMRANLRDIAAKVEQRAGLQPGAAVLDIGCNDGTLLDAYETPDLRMVGIDPSDAAAEAAAKGYQVIPDFFSREAVEAASPGVRFDAITSIAMFYDLEDPVAFARGVAGLLSPEGIWVIELSYLPTMLAKGSFDTVCHEHLEYYALGPIEWVLAEAGLAVEHIEFNEVNGGSFRLFIRHAKAGVEPSAEVEDTRRQEAKLGLRSDAPYADFREATERVRSDLTGLLERLAAEGEVVFAYGASTKGNTILQYCGIDTRLVAKAADRNPDKWGRRTLGTAIPIVSEEKAREETPGYFLVLPWHFLDGFLEREAAFLERGGKFIVPIPEVRVVDRAS